MRKAHNLRMTRQREVVLDVLRNSENHPTADEVYAAVRKLLPRISMGTIYRNLEILSERGLINKLEGTPMRFDGHIKDHFHLRCIRCETIADLHSKTEVTYEDALNEIGDWKIVGNRVEFFGICPACRHELLNV